MRAPPVSGGIKPRRIGDGSRIWATRTDGGDHDSYQGVESERRIGFGSYEGCVIGIRILRVALLGEPVQLAEVVPLDGFGEVSQELQEFSGGLGGQVERYADDGQVIRFHGGVSQGFFGFFADLDL